MSKTMNRIDCAVLSFYECGKPLTLWAVCRLLVSNNMPSLMVLLKYSSMLSTLSLLFLLRIWIKDSFTFDLTGADICDILESRDNPYHDDKCRFTSAGGVGGKMNSVSLPLKPPKIGAKERARLCSQIHSDFPNLPPSDRKYAYENRNHFYLFSVNDYGGNYTFWMKKKLTPENQAKFNAYRRMAENGEI